MEEALMVLLDSLPNLGVALLVLYWQKNTIDALLSHQRALIDRLLGLIEKVQALTDAYALNVPNQGPKREA